MILKILLCFIWLIMIPILLGMLLTIKMEKYKNSLIMPWILGYFIEFGIFEILALPINLITDSFFPLFWSWIIIVVILCATSIKINIKRTKEIFENIKNTIKQLPILITILALIMIGIQTFVPFRYMHLDDDDYNFVGQATTTYETNTFYKYTDSGNEAPKIDLRHELSPFPIYTALISKLITIHPAVTAHTIFPVILIPLAYCIYVLIGKNLFGDDLKKTGVFTIILSFIYIWGFYSLDTNFCFLLYRIWQGKAILANIAIPVLWLLYLEYSKNERQNIYWYSIIIVSIGSCLLTSMSLPIIPIELAALTIAYFIKDKKFIDFIKSGISVLPCFACAILYLILK